MTRALDGGAFRSSTTLTVIRRKKEMFNPFMMVTNLAIVIGVWSTLLCLLTGRI